MSSFINGLRKNGRSNTTGAAFVSCRGWLPPLLQDETTKGCQHQVMLHVGGSLFAPPCVHFGPGKLRMASL